jgi:hypothetical protein
VRKTARTEAFDENGKIALLRPEMPPLLVTP